MLRQLLQLILRVLAGIALRRFKPRIIAITGTVGKTSAKEAVAAVLATRFRVRQSGKNFNNEIGMPLSILGVESGGGSALAWAAVLPRAMASALFGNAGTYPEVLVLEFGIDKPGDMRYLASIAKPDYAFVTALGEVPVHVEFFGNPQVLWEEKLAIADGLKPGGVLFYNADDIELARLAPRKVAQAVAYGMAPAANIRAENVEKLPTTHGHSFGIGCNIVAGAQGVNAEFPFLLAPYQLSAVLAGVAAGLAFEIPLKKIVEALSGFEPPRGRLKPLKGIKNTLIIDDTYNASPSSTEAALGTLKDWTGHRRIAVLGDMAELGSYSDDAHRRIGDAAARAADVFFAVGSRMRLAAEEAKKAGMKDIRAFALSTEAGKPLELELRPGDVALVKGSQSMRMEKIVEEVMAEPDRAGEFLVRQDRAWKAKEVVPA